MAFRFRHTARLGHLRFHFGKAGLSSISVGGRGASFNIPMNRRGGPRTTVGLPGTGLSWSLEFPADSPPITAAAPAPATPVPGLPNSRRLRPSQREVFVNCCLAALHGQLFNSGSAGRQLWDRGLVSRLLADAGLGERQRARLAPIETPETLEAHLRRAVSLDDAKRRSNRCIQAVEEGLRLAAARGWLN